MPCPFPESRRAAIDRALMAAFGTAELDGAAQLSGGLSGAGVYRIRVGGIAYLLRLDGPANAFGDPARAYACMRTAAAACLAPRVHYACAEDRVTITDFVPSLPLALEYPGDGRPLVIELAQTIRALHQAPPFPPMVDYLDGMQELIRHHRTTTLLDPAATEPVLERYAALGAAYRTAAADRVSSHNDLNPGNIVYDGRRLWLVDWEAAFLADRFVDLATVANWFADAPEHEDLLLATYFGAPPTPEQRARLYLMRQVNHVFYGMIFLNVAAAERPEARVAANLDGPGLAEIGAGLASGAFQMPVWENRIAYAKARLRAAHAGMQGPAFEAALAAVAA